MDCLGEEAVCKPVSWTDRVCVLPKKLSRKLLLDNASVYRNEKIKRMCPIWEKRCLFLFYIPVFSSFEHCGDVVTYYEREMG